MFLRSKTVISPGWETILRTHGFDTVEGVYRLGSGMVVTRSASTEVRRVEVGSAPDVRAIFIKKYWVTKPAQLWKGMFRGTFFGRSKARREFENLVRLRAWGLDAPEAVAYGEERVSRWLLRSYLISQSVPQPSPLHLFIRSHLMALPATDARAVRRELIANLAAYTRRLHERRFVHHDYFWRNILIAGNSLSHFYLIDAHKGRLWLPGEELNARAADLAALDAPAPCFFRRTERLRFFLLYRQQNRLDAESKRLLRHVLKVAEPMRARQIRRSGGRLGLVAP